MAVYTVKEYTEILKPYIGVRGYRLMLKAAILDNLVILAGEAFGDSIERGGGSVTPPPR